MLVGPQKNSSLDFKEVVRVPVSDIDAFNFLLRAPNGGLISYYYFGVYFSQKKIIVAFIFHCLWNCGFTTSS